MLRVRLLSVLPLFSCLLAQAPPTAPPAPAAAAVDPIPAELVDAIAKEGIHNSQVMRLLRSLTHDVGHRLTGSDNFTKGCEWAKREFEAMGLEVELEQWGEWKLVWNRGAWIGRITKPVHIDMYVATEAWTPGTNGAKKGGAMLLPAAGTEVEAGSAAGKWVVSRRNNARARAFVDEQGALGLVYRANDPTPQFPTRVRVFGNHLTAMKPLEDVPTMPMIAVQADHFDRLADMIEEGKPVECEFDIRNTFRKGPIPLHNVIATLRGTELPDECVIVSSHLDSWHQVQGTTDNGTGTTTTMEAARILMAVGAKPKRSIKFCLWGGEEQGLLGSRGFVQRHRTDMTKVSACFNHDTGTNWAQSLSVTQAMYDQLAPVFAHVNRLLKAPDPDWDGNVFDLVVVPRVSGGGGSDHASFIAAGVPGLNWGLKGRSNYFEHTWHTQWDTFDVAIEEYQRHTATVIAYAALGTANLPALLDRNNVGAGEGGDRGRQSAAFAAAWFEAELDGLKFTSVKEGGRAARMGVQPGDVLTKVAGEELTSTRRIFSLARETEGDTVTFTFQRGDKAFDAQMKKDDVPPPPQRQRDGNAPPAATPPAATPPAGNPPAVEPPPAGGTPPSGGTPPPGGDDRDAATLDSVFAVACG